MAVVSGALIGLAVGSGLGARVPTMGGMADGDGSTVAPAFPGLPADAPERRRDDPHVALAGVAGAEVIPSVASVLLPAHASRATPGEAAP